MKFGQLVPVTITFSENVVVTGTPQLALNSGGTASYASGSGSATLTFNYTVGAGQNSADLDYVATTSLTLNSGTIKDGAGNAASLTLPATNAAGSLGTNKNIVIDTTAPTVTINQAVGQADPTNASPINFTVVFSESVSDFATGDVTLGGTAGATTATVTGSGTTYNVAVSGMTADGTVTASLAAAVAHDAATNPSAASTSTDNTVTYDHTAPAAPSITSSNPASPSTNLTPSLIGSAEAGSTVKIYTNNTCTSAVAATGTAAAFASPGLSVTVSANSSTTFYATATDAAGNTSACSTGFTYVNDTTAPTVTNVSSTLADGSYTVGQLVPVTITFSENVVVTGTPQLALNSGGAQAMPAAAAVPR